MSSLRVSLIKSLTNFIKEAAKLVSRGSFVYGIFQNRQQNLESKQSKISDSHFHKSQFFIRG